MAFCKNKVIKGKRIVLLAVVFYFFHQNICDSCGFEYFQNSFFRREEGYYILIDHRFINVYKAFFRSEKGLYAEVLQKMQEYR
ncbi:MAG TPA: hypothetical protein DCM31_00855 [Deferribacteraceae bacterium]|nr:hypothetical protein [Deferribacteraceae bacterium]